MLKGSEQLALEKFLCPDPPQPAAGFNAWGELFPASVYPIGGCISEISHNESLIFSMQRYEVTDT